jgi:hypothetical protein
MWFITVEIVALVVSILIIFIFLALAFAFAELVVGAFTSHEGDLGEGFIMMGIATGSLFFSVLLAVLVHIDILIRFLIRGKNKGE